MRRFSSFVAAGLVATVLAVTNAQAGSALIYGWESGLEGWATGGTKTLVNSTTLGVTQGAQSMVIDELPAAFSQDTVATVGSGPAFLAWQQAATRLFAGDTDVMLEFDLSYDNADAGGVAFAQLGIFLNSTNVGFTQYGTGQLIGGNIGGDFPRLEPDAITDGVTMTVVDGDTVHVAIPLGVRIGVGGPASTFYAVGLQTNGGWPGTVDWAIDNMTVTGANIIPEPGSLALAATGALGMAATRRRRRR
jgi:hypothetical protein